MWTAIAELINHHTLANEVHYHCLLDIFWQRKEV